MLRTRATAPFTGFPSLSMTTPSTERVASLALESAGPNNWYLRSRGSVLGACWAQLIDPLALASTMQRKATKIRIAREYNRATVELIAIHQFTKERYDALSQGP